MFLSVGSPRQLGWRRTWFSPVYSVKATARAKIVTIPGRLQWPGPPRGGRREPSRSGSRPSAESAFGRAAEALQRSQDRRIQICNVGIHLFYSVN
jgi:hypothetical protein